MSSNSSTWLPISFISFQKLINHHNNLRHLYRKPEVCWWWTHWTDAVYTEASHQDQDSQYCGCDHLARSPAASSQHQAGVAVLPAPTSGRHWHRTSGHLAASTLYRPHSAPPPRPRPRPGWRGCGDGRPRLVMCVSCGAETGMWVWGWWQTSSEQRTAEAGHWHWRPVDCWSLSSCLSLSAPTPEHHQTSVFLLSFIFHMFYFYTFNSIFIKWSQRTQINKYTTIIGTQTDGWWRSGDWMFVCRYKADSSVSGYVGSLSQSPSTLLIEQLPRP